MDLTVNVLSTDATDISMCISIAHVILIIIILVYIYVYVTVKLKFQCRQNKICNE